MAVSRLEQIAQSIEDTLAEIRQDNEYVDYPITLDIQRVTAKEEPRHLRGYIYQLNGTRNEEESFPYTGWFQQFSVVVYVLPEQDDATPSDTYNNQVAAVLYNAIMSNYQWDDLAIDTQVDDCLTMQAVNGEFGGVSFFFTVQYRHQINDATAL